jgi:exonuclease SbcD
VVRVRCGGIGQAAALRDKVAAWARVVDARPEPLWSCLDALAARETQQIVDDALAAPADGAAMAEAAPMPG